MGTVRMEEAFPGVAATVTTVPAVAVTVGILEAVRAVAVIVEVSNLYEMDSTSQSSNRGPTGRQWTSALPAAP